MSALSVTLGADITGLVHAMGKASHVVGDTARKMHKATGSGFAGIGKAGGAALMVAWVSWVPESRPPSAPRWPVGRRPWGSG